jgi:glycyl-tRNA synthetase
VNNLTAPFPFNLMFKTTIGPEGTAVGYLRPETAQGMFVNFRRLLEYNQQKMPFAAAQIGTGFRNEIAPRNGLLRVREFCMAEIEHFLDPKDKSHPKFRSVASTSLVLFPQTEQLGSGRTVTMTIGEAVDQGIVNNETLGYFMVRTQMFLEKIGVDPKRMRFRQHLKTEMAHYAADCWDMEIKMSYGWIECVGHADRAAYDLCQHTARTGVPLVASRRLAEPYTIDRVIIEPNKKLIGPAFKGDQKKVIDMLESMDEEAVNKLRDDLAAAGAAGVVVGGFKITPELVSFKSEKKTVSEEKYTPSVVEPAFGVGRIIYAVLEHSFSQRNGDEQRCVMSFPPLVAPIKVGIYRLINNVQFDPIVNRLRDSFQNANISSKIDSSAGTIGRRYARSDELGIAFGVTVDFQTLIDETVTVRDRDTMAQVRVPAMQLVGLISALTSGVMKWADVMQRYVVVNPGGDDADAEEGEGKKTSSSASPTIVEKNFRGCFSRPNPDFGK